MNAAKGRVALVVGTSGGIGRATAHAFAASGASVVVAAPNADALADLMREITEHGGQALVVPTDVEAFGRLAAAGNNAADARVRPTPLAEVGVEDFDRSRSAGSAACSCA